MKKIISVLVILCLTGCWNYYELNNLALCTGIAIDKIDDGYEVTYLISNAKKSESSSKEGEAGTTTYRGTGETIQEAINDLSLKMPFEPYNGHLVVTVISDSIARDGMDNVLDLLARDTTSRNFFYILLSKGVKAKDILEIISPLQTFPSQTIASDIETSSEKDSLIYKVTYNDFIYKMLEEGVHPVLNSVSIEGNVNEGDDEKELSSTVPKATIKIDTLGIFKSDKLIGWANDDESSGINILSDNVENVYVKTDCQNNYIMSYIENVKTDTKIDIDKGQVDVNVSGNSTILEVNCDINLEDPNEIKQLENNINNKLNDTLKKASNLVQNEYQSDVLGYGMLVHKKNPRQWKILKNNWDTDTFRNLKINTNVNIKIKSKGSLIQTIRGDE